MNITIAICEVNAQNHDKVVKKAGSDADHPPAIAMFAFSTFLERMLVHRAGFAEMKVLASVEVIISSLFRKNDDFAQLRRALQKPILIF